MKKYILKNIHNGVNKLNGSLWFVVDNSLLKVNIITPEFNDYFEWRIDHFTYSPLPYNPDGDTLNFTPLDMEDIILDSEDLIFLKLVGTQFNDAFSLDENQFKLVQKINSMPDDAVLNGKFVFSTNIFVFNYSLHGDIKSISWVEWVEKTEKTSFEKIFFPILKFSAEKLHLTLGLGY